MPDESNLDDATSPYDPIAAEDLRGFNETVGFRIALWRTDFARVELQPGPSHLNRSGVLHGGVLATLIDVAGGYCGVFPETPGRIRRCVTLSLSTSFIGRAAPGALVTCEAECRGGGKSIFMASCSVRDATGQLLATGQGVYRYIGEVASAAAQGNLPDDIPTGNTPTGNTPTGNTPTGNTPTGNTPTGGTSA